MINIKIINIIKYKIKYKNIKNKKNNKHKFRINIVMGAHRYYLCVHMYICFWQFLQ